jgi:hypothetical protein
MKDHYSMHELRSTLLASAYAGMGIGLFVWAIVQLFSLL